MKTLKVFYMIIITIILIFVMFTGTINLLISTTLLSNKYVAHNYDKYKLASKLSEEFYSKIEKPSAIVGAGQEILNGYKKTLTDAMKPEWFQAQANLLILQTHGYITNSDEKLPTINITPIKKVLPEMLISSIISQLNQNNDLTSANNMISIIKTKLENESKIGTTRADTVAQLLEESVIKEIKLNEVVVNVMVDKVAVMDEQQLTNVDFYNYMVELVINDKMKLNQMKDEVDLNSLVGHVFVDMNNPLLEIRNLVYSVKVTFLMVHLVVIICFLGTVFLIKMSLYKTIRFFGILCLPLGVLECLVGNLLMKGMEHTKTPNAFFTNVVKGMGEDVLTRYIFFGIETLTLGIVLIALSIVLKKMLKNNRGEIDHTGDHNGFSKYQRGIRLVGILMLLVVLSLSVVQSVKSFDHKMDSFSENMKHFSENMKHKDLSKILLNEMGIEYTGEINNSK